jgi:hypothetical protein
MPEDSRVTKSADQSLAALRPVDIYRTEHHANTVGQVALVMSLVHTLKQHQDPVVVQIISEIQDLCVEPWAQAGIESVQMEANEVEFYDLVLPAPGERATIGSFDKSDVHLPYKPIMFTHVEIECEEQEGDRRWTAGLSRPGGDHKRVSMKIGDETLERSTSDQNRFGHGEKLTVKPGDVIELGLIHVRLHAPE